MTSLFLFLLIFQPDEKLSWGGPLLDYHAGYDMKHLSLSLKVDPDAKTISGNAKLDVLITNPKMTYLGLNLVPSLKVEKVMVGGQHRPFKRKKNVLLVRLPESVPNQVELNVFYGGHPMEAKNPPWLGGFNWSRTDSGAPWVGVSCQGESGQVWFPCKAHPSDKIEGLELRITVPEPLYCAANGTLQDIIPAESGWRTFIWKSKHAIHSYNVSINIADFEVMERTFTGETSFPAIFYVLKEYQKGDQIEGDERSYQQKKEDLFTNLFEYTRFFSKYFGAYPWADEKLGIAHTKYLGMEHQTINSYGNHFRRRDGFDWLLFHELGHEWWGNKVSVGDWADYWIHEGFCVYATGVFWEEKKGLDAALEFYAQRYDNLLHEKPLVRSADATEAESYDGDIYNKGALVLHALRYLIGKPALDALLKQFATNPKTTFNNLASTEDFTNLVEAEVGRDLDWFFSAYLYTAQPPLLKVMKEGNILQMEWEPADFSMPVEVEITKGGVSQFHRVSFQEGKALFPLEEGVDFKVDPRKWVLKRLQVNN